MTFDCGTRYLLDDACQSSLVNDTGESKAMSINSDGKNLAAVSNDFLSHVLASPNNSSISEHGSLVRLLEPVREGCCSMS